MTSKRCLAIVLAAGEGTRMRSRKPKVLHAVGGRSLLAHVLDAVKMAGVDAVAVVVGPEHARVTDELSRIAPEARVFVQRERLGTAHAVLSAADAIGQGWDEVVVAFADTPLVRPETFGRLRAAVGTGAAVAALGMRPVDPTGYGRLIMQGERLVAIREDKDATPAERAIGFCNAGLMALSGPHALAVLRRIGNDNAKGEYYLTDAVEVAARLGLSSVALEAEEDEVRGINTRAQLAEAEAVLQRRLRAAAMEAGVTLVAPETVFLSADTKLGRDVVIEPNVVFGPGVVVEDDAVIHAFSHLEGAHVGRGTSVGPFARLRPGTRLGENVRIGNFVETKAVEIAAGAKANHLAYLGDGRVGEGANIGAGTIFCNYDGVAKHRTEIGDGAFVGSNSALVAPVTVGDGAYVATGSVITENVPPQALAIARGRQVNKENRAAQMLKAKSAVKKQRVPAAE